MMQFKLQITHILFTSLPQVVISGALCSQDFIYSAQCKDSTAVHVSETGKVRLMELSKVQRKYSFLFLLL